MQDGAERETSSTRETDVERKEFWHALWPLSPPPPDNKAVQLLASAEMTATEGWRWHIFLLGRPGVIDVIGASFPAYVMLSGEPFHHYASEALNRAFAAASMVYSSDIKLLELSAGKYISLGQYSDDELPQGYGVHIQMPEFEPNWDLASLLHLATAEGISTEILSVLSEATDTAIPRHYRFLSLCRALELLVSTARDRTAWLERYEADFRALNVDPKRLRNFIPELRNRCAHGTAGEQRAIFGRIERSVAVATHGVPTTMFNLMMRLVIEKLCEVAQVQIRPPVLVDADLQPLDRRPGQSPA